MGVCAAGFMTAAKRRSEPHTGFVVGVMASWAKHQFESGLIALPDEFTFKLSPGLFQRGEKNQYVSS